MFGKLFNWGEETEEDKKRKKELEERKRRLRSDYDPVKERLDSDPVAAKVNELVETYISSLFSHDLVPLMSRYNEESVLYVILGGEEREEYKGRAAIQQFFETKFEHFPQLKDEEKKNSLKDMKIIINGKMASLHWQFEDDTLRVPYAVDTFEFDDEYWILRHRFCGKVTEKKARRKIQVDVDKYLLQAADPDESDESDDDDDY